MALLIGYEFNGIGQINWKWIRNELTKIHYRICNDDHGVIELQVMISLLMSSLTII